ncbi:hypothetical protein AWENTII_001584 [Aspergillus wentii]
MRDKLNRCNRFTCLTFRIHLGFYYQTVEPVAPDRHTRNIPPGPFTGSCHWVEWNLFTFYIETAYALPKSTESAPTTTFETLYPPSTEGARVLIPNIQEFYPTSLEREGHPINQQPFPTFGLNDLLGGLEDTDSLVDQLVSDLGPNPVSSTHAPATTLASYTVQTEPTVIKQPMTIPTVISTASITHPETPTSTTAPQPTTSVKESAFSSDGSYTSETHTISPENTSEPVPEAPKGTNSAMTGQDVFVPVSTGGIPSSIKSRDDHLVSRWAIDNKTTPIETNKFYAGLFLGTQTNATFTHPYTVAWAKGWGNASSFGMAVSHTELDKTSQGPQNTNIPGNPISNYVNAIGIQSVILSAAELKGSTLLTTENPLPFSANAVLRPDNGSTSRITFPVVQGMGFVTGIYTNLQPLIQSSIFFRHVVPAGSPRPGIYKYRLTMEDNMTWLLYAIPQNGNDPKFKLESMIDLCGPSGWSGILQVAKNPQGPLGEKLFDNSAGVFATEGVVSGYVSQDVGTYSLAWAKSGKDVQSTPLLMFALPHHVESFDNSTRSRMTSIQLRTTTKGNATAVVGEIWNMNEPGLPIDMGFAPWSVQNGSANGLSDTARKTIIDTAPVELDQDMDGQTNLSSMYFSGKALSKFATMVYTVDKLANNPTLAAPALDKLKKCFARFVDNQQQFPLVYDNVWKGVVSSASYVAGDPNTDFGNTLYNDHHFHYGYFIHAAAIIGHLDPSWLSANKDWVNMLVRDAGNAATNDPHFPFSRGYDWFHGHSWAKGLFESFDGKDQESTSEDTMFAYSLKMWGKTIGDASMEARGNLMLGILRRTLRNYFLMESDNKNQPANFVPNKVTGIVSGSNINQESSFG